MLSIVTSYMRLSFNRSWARTNQNAYNSYYIIINFIILIEFNDLQSIVEPLKNREDNLKGVLVDTYVAGEMPEFSSDELRVNKIIDDDSYYGIVFGEGQLTENPIQNCFSSYVLSHKAEIFEIVKQGTQAMSVSNVAIQHKRLVNLSHMNLIGLTRYILNRIPLNVFCLSWVYMYVSHTW